MTAFSWWSLLLVVIFFLLMRFVVPPNKRHVLMTCGAVAVIMAQNAPMVLIRFGFATATVIILVGGWVGANLIARRPPDQRRAMLIGTVVFLVAPLILFKLVQTVVPVRLLDVLTSTRGKFDLGSLAPLGISYFTFRALAYAIEIARGTIQPVGWWRYLNYVAFWPTFLAGPIERPGSFLQQTETVTPIHAADVRIGVARIVMGLGKKMVLGAVFYQVAKPFLLLQTGAKNLAGWSTAETWIALTAYYLYLYCDFAGYSDAAIGTARLFGYRIRENFRLPVLATNVGEFWRRWHMSLTGWITDYVYIGLGGNRQGLSRAARNTFVAMLVVGLWHGLSLNFALWGLYHACWLNAYRLYRKRRSAPPPRTWWRTALAWFVTFQIINLGWVLFVFPTRVAVMVYLRLFGLS